MDDEVKPTPTRRIRVFLKTKRYTVLQPLQIIAIVFCALMSIGIIIALIFIVLHPCTNDSQCARENTCTLDYCDTFCHHDWIEGCCFDDPDCEIVDCHNSVCDKGTCRVIQVVNNTACNDHSLCTVNDRCVGGMCSGNALNCNVNSCAEATCDSGIGCLYTSKDDGTTCDDANLCTIGDVCYSGLCASGVNKDCSNLDGVCTVGVCDLTTGDCISANRDDETVCDDLAECSVNDQCVSGVCQGTINSCDDNNPCSVNLCVAGVGCMIQYQYDLNNTCQPGCTDDASCPSSFICHDGTCINVPTDSNIDVRFLDYTIENCTGVDEHRLIMSFTMDADTVSIAGTEYYQIVKETTDLTTSTTQSLGFIDDVLNLNSAVIETNRSRTAFALTTACQVVDVSNCATIFKDKNYDFDAKILSCENISPIANCIDGNLHVQAHIPVSMSDCSMFPQSSVVTVYGEANAYFLNKMITKSGEIDISNNPSERLYIALNTTVLNNVNFVAHNYYITVCQPKEDHQHSHCVTGEPGEPCPIFGCYNWDNYNSFDSPIQNQLSIMELGYFTALAESVVDVDGAFPSYSYHATQHERCQAEQKTTWDKPGDDGFSIAPNYFKPVGLVRTVLVFDMIYRVTGCDTNVLRSTEQHQLSTIFVV